MSFFLRYELKRLVADREIQTFHAKEIASGAEVFLHFIKDEPPFRPMVVALRQWLNDPGRREQFGLREIGEFSGQFYVVTNLADNCRDLRVLLSQPDAAPPPSQIVQSAPLPVPSSPEATEPGEFTKLFQASPAMAAPPERPHSAPPPQEPGEFTRLFSPQQPPPSPPQQTSGLPAPGEFTRLFSSPPASAPVAPSVPTPAKHQTPAPAPISLKRDDQPLDDEFARMFGKPQSSTPQPAGPAWPASSSKPGDLPDFFGSLLEGESIDIDKAQKEASSLPRPAAKPFQQAGEFTRMFGSKPGEQAKPDLARPEVGLGERTTIFGTKRAVPTLTKSTEAGEYTRVIRGTDPARAPVAPAPVAPAPELAKTGVPPKYLWIALGVLVAMLVVLVVLLIRARR